MRPVEVEDREVRELPGLDRAQPVPRAEGAGPVDRREVERPLRREHGRVPAGGLVQERRHLHLLEQIHPVVADRAVRAQRDRDARLEHLREGRDTAGRELHVRRGAVGDLDAVPAEGPHLVQRDPDAVGGDDAVTEEPNLLEPLHGAQGRLLPVVVHLGAGLGEVGVEPRVQGVREGPGARPRLLGGHVHALDSDGRRHELVALHLPGELLRVLQRAPPLGRERLVEDDPRQEAADPGLAHAPRDLVLPVEQVVERRRAGFQHLDAPEERAHLHVPPREPRVDRERGLEHRLERDVVRRPAEERVRDVVVRVDQPGEDRHVRAVDHPLRGVPDLPHRGNPPVLDEHVPPEDLAAGVLRDDVPAAQ